MEIKTFEICNNYGVNNLVFTVDKYTRPTETILKEEDGSSYVYGESEDGFVTYGIVHGNECWSSRGSVFNGMFRKRVVDNVVVKANRSTYSAAMTVESCLPYLPKGYYIIELAETDSKGNIAEVSYYISNPKHERENRFMFESMTYAGGERRYIQSRIYP